MKKILFVPVTVVALLFAFNAAIASADEKKEGAEPKAASVEEKMDNLVKQGPGIHNIKKDDKGRVQSLIVVGQSRISTVLGATKGKEVARKRAEQITGGGDLILWRDGENGPSVNLAFAKGQWLVTYAASFLDGSALAVDHWEGEVVR